MMSEVIRARMRLVEVTENCHNPEYRTFSFRMAHEQTVIGEPQAKYVPIGEVSIMVSDPAVIQRFQLGKVYNVDFSDG